MPNWWSVSGWGTNEIPGRTGPAGKACEKDRGLNQPRPLFCVRLLYTLSFRSMMFAVRIYMTAAQRMATAVSIQSVV